MRLVILIDSLTVGGTEIKSVKLANELIARDKTVRLAYLEDTTTLLARVDKRVPTYCLHRKGKFSLTALRNLSQLITEHQVSVVLCMNQYPLLYAALLKLFLGHSSLKVILAINTTEFGRKRDRWFMFIYAPLIRRIEAVVFGCKYQMILWQRNYNLRGVRSRVIYNGIDTAYFRPNDAPESLRGELEIGKNFVIGCVGRLDPEKNQSVLLDVVAKLSRRSYRFDVLLVGAGPERLRLEGLSVDLGIREQVHFVGRMDDVRSALVTMDVFVLPSIETFSNAALEAMAMSLPVILNDIGGASEMVTDRDDGFLYEGCDLARLADLLVELESDRQLGKRIGQRARETVLSRFNIKRMIDDYESVLSDT
jgi:glycosyltransferase involved in cell wall biosynthesis